MDDIAILKATDDMGDGGHHNPGRFREVIEDHDLLFMLISLAALAIELVSVVCLSICTGRLLQTEAEREWLAAEMGADFSETEPDAGSDPRVSSRRLLDDPPARYPTPAADAKRAFLNEKYGGAFPKREKRRQIQIEERSVP